jgi:hypothetical protein
MVNIQVMVNQEDQVTGPHVDSFPVIPGSGFDNLRLLWQLTEGGSERSLDVFVVEKTILVRQSCSQALHQTLKWRYNYIQRGLQWEQQWFAAPQNPRRTPRISWFSSTSLAAATTTV